MSCLSNTPPSLSRIFDHRIPSSLHPELDGSFACVVGLCRYGGKVCMCERGDERTSEQFGKDRLPYTWIGDLCSACVNKD